MNVAYVRAFGERADHANLFFLGAYIHVDYSHLWFEGFHLPLQFPS